LQPRPRRWCQQTPSAAAFDRRLSSHLSLSLSLSLCQQPLSSVTWLFIAKMPQILKIKSGFYFHIYLVAKYGYIFQWIIIITLAILQNYPITPGVGSVCVCVSDFQ
jgi:hypothetical protein